VVTDDGLMVDRIPDAQVGEEVVLENVLLIGSADHTVIGKPTLPGASVTCVVEEHTQTRKLRVFKKRRRTASSKRTVGHRSQVTIMRVTGMEIGPDAEAVMAAGVTATTTE
jgi:large subunit ribosomal protein L21